MHAGRENTHRKMVAQYATLSSDKSSAIFNCCKGCSTRKPALLSRALALGTTRSDTLLNISGGEILASVAWERCHAHQM